MARKTKRGQVKGFDISSYEKKFNDLEKATYTPTRLKHKPTATYAYHPARKKEDMIITKPTNALKEWHKFFSILPRQLEDGSWVFLHEVERKLNTTKVIFDDRRWLYRRVPETETNKSDK